MFFLSEFFGVDTPEESYNKEKALIDFQCFLPCHIGKSETKESIRSLFIFSKLVSQVSDDLEEGQTKVIHCNTNKYHLEIQKKYGEIRILDFDQWS